MSDAEIIVIISGLCGAIIGVTWAGILEIDEKVEEGRNINVFWAFMAILFIALLNSLIAVSWLP
jgi:hypothetical protein